MWGVFRPNLFSRHDSSFKSPEFHSGLGVSLNGNDNSKNTVQGTFEDLSEEEKTRALLQFLQYQQQQEQESETKRFKEMIQNGANQDGLASSLTPAEIQVRRVILCLPIFWPWVLKLNRRRRLVSYP